jgi:hypothetical protein
VQGKKDKIEATRLLIFLLDQKLTNTEWYDTQKIAAGGGIKSKETFTDKRNELLKMGYINQEGKLFSLTEKGERFIKSTF